MPFTVKVNAAPLAVADAGFKLVIAGDGLLIVKLAAGDDPPPGAGFITTTFAVPAVAMSLAGITAVNCVALTNVAVRAPPFHHTVEPLTKFDPLMVRVNAAPPAVAEFGLRLEIVGVGLLIVKRIDPDTPPPGAGLLTVTLAVPAVAMSVAGIVAVSCVALINVVVRGLPFHCTEELLMKFVPFTVSVNAPTPAVATNGLMLVTVGTGFCAWLIVKLTELDVPPPGAGVTTVMLAVPVVAMSEAGSCAVS
jgi:hypothetical protein